MKRTRKLKKKIKIKKGKIEEQYFCLFIYLLGIVLMILCCFIVLDSLKLLFFAEFFVTDFFLFFFFFLVIAAQERNRLRVYYKLGRWKSVKKKNRNISLYMFK